jgi:hypothetical protein
MTLGKESSSCGKRYWGVLLGAERAHGVLCEEEIELQVFGLLCHTGIGNIQIKHPVRTAQ